MFGSMKLPTLIATLALTISTVASSRDHTPEATKHVIYHITGALVMHWEYPHLVTDNNIKSRNVFEFKFANAKWRRDFFDQMAMSPTSDIYYICVSGVGYVDYHDLGETGRPTFVFTSVSSTSTTAAQGGCHRGKLAG